MEELIGVLQEIRDGINSINNNIELLKDSVDDLKGSGLYDSISDVCDKLDNLENEVNSIKGSPGYDLSEIYNCLSSIDTNTSNL